MVASTTRLGGNTGILVGSRSQFEVGSTVHVLPDVAHIHIFDTASGNRL